MLNRLEIGFPATWKFGNQLWQRWQLSSPVNLASDEIVSSIDTLSDPTRRAIAESRSAYNHPRRKLQTVRLSAGAAADAQLEAFQVGDRDDENGRGPVARHLGRSF